MIGTKTEVDFQVQKDLVKMLDYIATDADWEKILQKKRCISCGPDGGWSPPNREE